LNIPNALREFFKRSPDCQQLILYQGRVFRFVGLGADAPGLTVSLAKIKIGIKKLEHATQVARNLDMYQFQMCRITHELEKQHPLREELIRVRIVGLGFLTSFSNTLSAFNADPKGQRTNLNRAVREMQNFVRHVAKSILSQLTKGSDPLTKKQILSIRSNIEKVDKGRAVTSHALRDWESRGAASYPARPRASPEQRAQRRAEAYSHALEYVGLGKSEVDELVNEFS
jgi:hypothetical protein